LDPRIPRALALYAFVVVGVFLLLSPWTPIWMEVTRGLLPLNVQAWTSTGWLRGTVSGLGALNLLVAFQVGHDLVRGRRSSKGPKDE
jgi:hypothetical protein